MTERLNFQSAGAVRQKGRRTSPHVMCAYGNCNETMQPGDYKLTLTTSNRGHVENREVFCCLEHAWKSLKALDERFNAKRED